MQRFPKALQAVFESLRDRGVRTTLDVVFAELESWLFDLRWGVETARKVQLKELTIASENRAHGVHYEATRPRQFRRVVSALGSVDTKTLVDFGSGKGRILMLAAGAGFRRVIGIEFSPELCRIARTNLRTFVRRSSARVQWEVVESDVVEWAVDAEANVFFFYVPFEPLIMREVVRNIRRSVEAAPRQVWVVYHGSPRSLWASEFEAIFASEGNLTRIWHEVVAGSSIGVWSNESTTLVHLP